MPNYLKAVFFDVDGVLVDSLCQHLNLCRDKAKEFGLDLKIPSIEEFRELVRRGIKVSPMRYFFLAIGFPMELIARAVDDYEVEFMKSYKPKTFAGISAMLSDLRAAGLELGLVTFNSRSNVIPALGASINLFNKKCLFLFDRYHQPRSKQWCLSEGARLLRMEPEECVYVGDQPADAVAAAEAGTRFLGVTYGWGIKKEDKLYETVGDLEKFPPAVGCHRVAVE